MVTPKATHSEVDRRPHRHTKKGKFDLEKALWLRKAKGMSLREIASTQGITKSGVWKGFRRMRNLNALEQMQPIIDEYRKAKTLYLDGAQMIAMNDAIDPEKLKKNSAVQSAVEFGIFYDKNRIEQGKPTEIINFEENKRILLGIVTERERLLNHLRGIKGEIINEEVMEEKEGSIESK